ncbi:DUF6232 family protein [Pseudomonas sediminis]|jgi:hypothetical protein|uniref:QacE n=1 Tax=Pseudomonas sediminis TaxID=1691904 RepID=A0A2G5FGQ8_9PSED|nr:hypothetical protein CDO35_17155 [Pseudomonas sediminis]
MEAIASEKVFFDKHGIKVTNARFIAHKQTYAMASVSSVKVGVADLTPSKTGPIVLIVIGAFWLLGAFSSSGLMAKFMPLAMVALGVWWFRSIKPRFEYKIVLTTSSGETTALTSNSEPDIRVVEDALNQAIVYRG